MSRLIPDARSHVFLNAIADECSKVAICSTQLTNYTEANSTYQLGEVTVKPGASNRDYEG